MQPAEPLEAQPLVLEEALPQPPGRHQTVRERVLFGFVIALGVEGLVEPRRALTPLLPLALPVPPPAAAAARAAAAAGGGCAASRALPALCNLAFLEIVAIFIKLDHHAVDNALRHHVLVLLVFVFLLGIHILLLLLRVRVIVLVLLILLLLLVVVPAGATHLVCRWHVVIIAAAADVVVVVA